MERGDIRRALLGGRQQRHDEDDQREGERPAPIKPSATRQEGKQQDQHREEMQDPAEVAMELNAGRIGKKPDTDQKDLCQQPDNKRPCQHGIENPTHTLHHALRLY